jgi:hypothetical protein
MQLGASGLNDADGFRTDMFQVCETQSQTGPVTARVPFQSTHTHERNLRNEHLMLTRLVVGNDMHTDNFQYQPERLF